MAKLVEPAFFLRTSHGIPGYGGQTLHIAGDGFSNFAQKVLCLMFGWSEQRERRGSKMTFVFFQVVSVFTD